MAVFKNVHIRRTSKEQLEEELNKGGTEIWGYRTNSGDVVAVVMIRHIDSTSGLVELLSVLPEYMGLGLSSSLIRNSEFVLHEAEKRTMQMKVFLPRDFNVDDFSILGYSILTAKPWVEMEDVLKPEALNSWVMVTFEKSI